MLTDEESIALRDAINEAGKNTTNKAGTNKIVTEETDEGTIQREFTAADVIMVSTAKGIMLKNETLTNLKKSPIDNKVFCGIIENAIDDWKKILGFEPEDGRIFHDSNGIWNNWEDNKKGEEYASWLTERGSSDLFNASVLLFGDDVRKVLRKYSEEYGWGEVPNLLTKDDITEEQKQRVKDKYSSTGWYQKLKEERPGTLLQSTIVESTDDIVNGVVDSYIIDKSTADFSDNFVSDVLREVKYAYNYPERNYNTVTTPSLLYLLRAEARQSTDFTDFVLRAEENYGLDGEEFDLEDLQNIFDDVNALPMQDQNVGTLEAPNVNIEDKAEQFTEILSSKSNFEEFLNALRNAKNLDGASLFINNLLASLNDNNTLTTDGFRIAYGQVLESPELYMDLYAQATGNTYWQSSEIAGGEISEEMSSDFDTISKTDVDEIEKNQRHLPMICLPRGSAAKTTEECICKIILHELRRNMSRQQRGEEA